MNHQAKMVNFYFGQTDHYMSESGDKLTPIKDMHPAHAANAARRLLTDGYTWAKDAGQDTKTYALWVLKSALFRALTARATEPESIEFVMTCSKCDEPGERVIDPYRQELWSEEIYMVLCSSHLQERRDEI